MSKKVYFAICILLLAVVACNAPTNGLPTPAAISAASNTAVPTVQVTETPANPQPVSCTVRTFIQDEKGSHEQTDSNIVLGEWSDGFSTFQEARICEFVVAHGATSYDVILDAHVNNVSVVFDAKIFPWEDVQAFAKELGIARIGIVHTHPAGRSCIEYDVAQATTSYGPVLYYHMYDRNDWSANPVYYCPAMPLPSATPGS